jgi:multidrug efflux system outer membrane protein
MGRLETTRASLFPELDAKENFTRARASQDTGAKVASVKDPSAPQGGAGRYIPAISSPNPVNSIQLAVSASWQVDLWGKFRRANEAARANLLSAQETKRGVILTLVASVVDEYINLRDLDHRLEIANHTAKSREDAYNLFKLRYKAGVISELELSQAESEYESAAATIPAIEKAVAQQENELSLLLGRNPDAIARGKALDELALPPVPAGLPSSLLTNRPDILQAEQDLVAANAQIGAARAQYFPSISLTGAFGRASNDLSSLFTGPAKMWSYSVPVTAPIFTAGAIAGQVKAAKAAREEMLVRYQQKIQSAFRDVDDALADQKYTREQLDAQIRQTDALRNYARLARRRYENGYTSYIEVLDAERNLFNSELSLASTRGGLFQSMVKLYKAMGGGWVTKAEKKTVLPEKPDAHG